MEFAYFGLTPSTNLFVLLHPGSSLRKYALPCVCFPQNHFERSIPKKRCVDPSATFFRVVLPTDIPPALVPATLSVHPCCKFTLTVWVLPSGMVGAPAAYFLPIPRSVVCHTPITVVIPHQTPPNRVNTIRVHIIPFNTGQATCSSPFIQHWCDMRTSPPPPVVCHTPITVVIPHQTPHNRVNTGQATQFHSTQARPHFRPLLLRTSPPPPVVCHTPITVVIPHQTPSNRVNTIPFNTGQATKFHSTQARPHCKFVSDRSSFLLKFSLCPLVASFV